MVYRDRVNVSLYKTTLDKIEEISQVFKKNGLKYSKCYIVDIAVRLLYSMVFGKTDREVSGIIESIIRRRNI